MDSEIKLLLEREIAVLSNKESLTFEETRQLDLLLKNYAEYKFVRDDVERELLSNEELLEQLAKPN